MHESIAGLQIQRALFVWGIVLVAFAVFFWGQAKGYHSLHGWFMPDSAVLLWKSLWTCWTPVFIHYTWVHLLINLYFWWDFGSVVELVSRPLLVFLFFSAAFISNLCEYLMFGPEFGGMSGIIYTLFGFLWIHTICYPAGVFTINPLYVVALLVNLVLCLTGLIGDFSNTAHISGLAYGILAGYCYGKMGKTAEKHHCG